MIARIALARRVTMNSNATVVGPSRESQADCGRTRAATLFVLLVVRINATDSGPAAKKAGRTFAVCKCRRTGSAYPIGREAQ